jgi:membrane fusion protein, heavy metal efflux system
MRSYILVQIKQKIIHIKKKLMALLIISLMLLHGSSISFAHGGEDHSKDKKPSGPVPAGSARISARRAERTISTSDGQFQFFLTQVPSDARNGEEAQFEIRAVELVEQGFDGGQAPLEGAKVTGQFMSTTGSQVSEPIPAHKEGQPDIYGIHYVFKDSGDYKIFFDIVTSDGRKVSVDFPVVIAAAPVRYAPYMIDLILLIAALSFVIVRYRTVSQSLGSAQAVRWTLPYAVVALAFFTLSASAVHYLIPAEARRDIQAGSLTSAPFVAAADPDSIIIPKESQINFGIRIKEVKKEIIVSGLTVTGFVKVRPQFKAEVVPPVSGRTKAVGNITVGSYVKEGQTIAIVEQILSAPESADLEARRTELRTKTAELQAQAGQASTRRNGAQIELNRAKRLYEAGAAPLKRVQEAELQLQLAEQELASAQKQARITQVGEERVEPIKIFALRAPISGVISGSNFTPGEQVEAGSALFTIMKLDRVWIEAQVFEKDLGAITTAKRATFKAAAFPDQVFQIGENTPNQLLTVGASVDPEKRTVSIVYEVENINGKLRDGMTAEITIDTTGGHGVISVPKDAVIDEQGKKFVFVFNGGEVFSKRIVNVGSQGQTDFEILSGLKPGERVVVEGIYQLRSTAPGTGM